MKRTPLDRGDKPLTRRTPMPRTGPPTTRKAPEQRTTRGTRSRKTPRDTGPTVDVKQQVDARDTCCLICGGPATNRQHREGRGAGGRGQEDAERTNGVAWLFRVCGQGNTSGCHQAIDLDPLAFEKGWRIRRNGPVVDATTVPILCFDGWHLLTADACRVPCPAPEGWVA